MSLYEIVYVSRASEEMPQEALTALLDKARSRNAEQGVTGVMIYHRRSFMQLLEGDKADVLALYERIARDPRHTQLRKLWDGPIAQRSFADWGMAFFAPDAARLAQHPGFRDLLSQELTALASDNMGKQLLMSLREDMGMLS